MKIPLLTRLEYPIRSKIRQSFCCISTATSELSSTPIEISASSTDTMVTTNLCSRIVDTERDNVTQLVDRLFERTRHLMLTTAAETNTLRQNDNMLDPQKNCINIDRLHHHTIAYSGGIDSSLVAAIVYQISLDLNSATSSTTSTGKFHHHTVTAVLGISPAVSIEQIQQAEEVAAHIGISFIKIPTDEGKSETYIANNGHACFACKSELYTKLIHHTIANYTQQHRSNSNATTTTTSPTTTNGLESVQNYIIHNNLYNGTNADDCLDPTRVGLIAASQYNVVSPLNTNTKEEVRKIAKHLHLPNWNVASNPCLRSRLAIGISATKEHLQRIEKAERFVRQQLYNLTTVETNLRVRQLSQQHGCLEIDSVLVDDAINLYRTNQIEWDKVLLQELQFHSFTIRPFRSGSVSLNPSVASSLLSSTI